MNTTKTWEQLVDEGRRLVAEEGDIKFRLGDLALEIDSHQGARADLSEHSEKSPLAQFADEVGVPYQRLAEYRQVAEAWPPSKRSTTAPWVVHLRFKNRDDRFELIANPPESVNRRTGEITRRWTDTLACRELGAKLPNRTPDQRSTQEKVEQVREHLADPDVAAVAAVDSDIRTSFTQAQRHVADDLDEAREGSPPHRAAKRNVERTRALETFIDFRVAIKRIADQARQADFGTEWRDTVIGEAKKTRDAVDLFIDLIGTDPDAEDWDRALADLAEGGDR